jgi:hypothetical protein
MPAIPFGWCTPIVASALCGLLVGCSSGRPTLVPVTGRVLFNGEGVTAGSIHLHPGASAEYSKDNPSSLLQTDGSFSFKTFPFGHGVAPGEYVVTLSPEVAQRLSHPKYASVTESPWKIEVVPPGLNDLEFVVKK